MQPIAGNLFDSGADVLVNPVNCVGVSGAGLALEFRKRFPRHQLVYEAACRAGRLLPGTVLRCDLDGQAIIYFPTKRHWRQPSRLQDISDGLIALRQELTRLGDPASVAIPGLGCGRGGLAWEDVLAEISATLAPLEPRIQLLIYPPWCQPLPRR